MTRRLPGALALGLTAAIWAHTIVYGDGHVMGGSYAEFFRALATAAVVGSAALWVALCLLSRGRFCQGSVLTASITQFVPSLPSISAAAFGWFSLAEAIESGHPRAPTLAIAVSLVAASALLVLLARVGLRALAKIVFAIYSGDFATRVLTWVAIAEPIVTTKPVVRVLRLFSRPPPALRLS